MPNDLNFNTIYKDREEAAKELIDTIESNHLLSEDTVIMAVSEGGIFFADRISSAFGCDMDILLTEPILAPNNPELAIAIVSETEDVVMDKALIDAFEIDEDYIYSEASRNYDDTILSYVYKYRKGVPLRSLHGKKVVLTDEAIESGLTMTVALKSMIEMGAKSIYIAVPVLDQTVYDNLLNLCDGVFCPNRIRDYISIEYYYETLEPLEFEVLEQMIEAHGITDTREKKETQADE